MAGGQGIEGTHPCVLSRTADAELLGRPLKDIGDVIDIERVPLEARLGEVDFFFRLQAALEAHEPDSVAISFVADGNPDGAVEEVTFDALRRQIDRVSLLLAKHGIGAGDVVAIVMPTMPAIYSAIIGAMACAIPFPVNWMLEPEHLFSLIVESRAKAVIALGPTPGFKIWESLMSVHDRLPKDLPIWSVRGPGGDILGASDFEACLLAAEADGSAPRTERRRRRGEEVAAYLHSGGTTGVPKIVLLTHRNLSYRHWAQQLALQVEFGEVVLQDTPVFHVGGLAGRSLPMLACGCRLVIPSVMGARDKRYIENYWRFVERFRLTRLSGVPTMFSMLAKTSVEGADLSSLKPYFQTGSTALPISVRRDFERISGVEILNSYGLTENTATAAVDLRDGIRKEGSSGMRVPYTHLRITALGGTPRLCRTDEIGMIEINGPGVTPGYLDAEKTGAARTEDGWLITGDLGRLDADQMLFVTGRAKDVIIRGGHNIDPGPIEDALMRAPAVLLAAAVGKPDSHAGEIPMAFVELQPGSNFDETQLIAVAAESISERAAIPKQIVVLDRLPLTGVGKPDKVKLKELAAKLAFEEALAGVASSVAGLAVSVASDPSRGTVITIEVDTDSDRRFEAVSKEIRQVMDRFAFPNDIFPAGAVSDASR